MASERAAASHPLEAPLAEWEVGKLLQRFDVMPAMLLQLDPSMQARGYSPAAALEVGQVGLRLWKFSWFFLVFFEGGGEEGGHGAYGFFNIWIVVCFGLPKQILTCLVGNFTLFHVVLCGSGQGEPIA